MAINWLAKDAARAIQEGKVENILDIGKRFPLFTVLAAQCNEAGLKLIDTLPKYVTARTIEAALKGDAVAATGDDNEDDDGAPDPAPTPAPAKEKEKAPAKEKEKAPAKAPATTDYTGKSPKELFTLATERGITVEPRQPAEIYVKALKAADAAIAKAAAKAAAAKTPATPAGDDWDDEPAKPAGKPAPAADDDWDL